MNEPRLCCNCLHCARWKKKDGIECHCDLDDRYLGYLTVMDEENDCKHWEKETKWDLEREHDKQIKAEAFDEFINTIKPRLKWDNDIYTLAIEHCIEVAEQLKRKNK